MDMYIVKVTVFMKQAQYEQTPIFIRVNNPLWNGILFRFSLLYENSYLEYVHIHVLHRVRRAEYIRVAVSQKYLNTYSTPRGMMLVQANSQTVHISRAYEHTHTGN